MVPESPRYLITHNRTEEAKKIFKRIAKSNKRTYGTGEPVSVNDEFKSKADLVVIKADDSEAKEVRILSFR